MNTFIQPRHAAIEDLYPSRVSEIPELRERLDPVVRCTPGVGTALTPADTRTFEENGFLVFRSLFSEQEVARWQKEMTLLCRDFHKADYPEIITERDSGEVRSVFAIHELSSVFRELAHDPRLVDIARFILDDDVYIHQSRVNYKPGFVGREFSWHSDFETWHVEDGMPRMRAVSMSIMLSDNYDFNGPLMLIPGSHRTYVSCVGATPDDHYKQSLQQQAFGVPDRETLRSLVQDGGIQAPTGKSGMMLIFDCNTIHGSNGNITPFPRSNAFFVYNAVNNALVEPFGAPKPRPYFLGSRDFTPIAV